MSLKPMLAAKADFTKLTYPRLLSPKLDGIRALVSDGKVLSRALKLIPNRYIQHVLGRPQFEGLDGELIVGHPAAPECFLKSTSGVMSHEGEPQFVFWVFDRWDSPAPFAERLEAAREAVLKANDPHVHIVGHDLVHSLDELNSHEEMFITAGYEGVMLRDPRGLYKFGRSTVNEGGLLKVKRFEDSEAEILEVIEEMHNTNEAQTNELGRTKRSTAKAGLVGKGTMGALRVRDIHHGWEFCIGTGFTMFDREQKWKLGDIVTYKYFPVGMKDVPRHPVYKGLRSKLDL